MYIHIFFFNYVKSKRIIFEILKRFYELTKSTVFVGWDNNIEIDAL